MTAKELIIGQDSALRVLERALDSGRVAHCYVFTGPEGVGKRTAALALAKALQCERQHPDDSRRAERFEFCSACAACRQIQAECHPDVLVWADRPRALLSSGRSHRIYSGPLTMEEARQFKEEMSLAPALGKRRVFIVDRADQMDSEPANSLLKTLEEPPGQRVLVLLAENPGRLLPTILSRTQLVRFGLVEESIISRWLNGLFPGMDPDLQGRAVALAGGRPGWAYLFAVNPGILELIESALEALVKVASGDPYAPFTAPAILRTAAKEWHRLVGEGTPPGGNNERKREENDSEETALDSEVVREYLPLLLNAVLSFFRHTTSREGNGSRWGAKLNALSSLSPHQYAKLLPIVGLFLRRLAANVNVSLLLQLLCLEIADSGRRIN